MTLPEEEGNKEIKMLIALNVSLYLAVGAINGQSRENKRKRQLINNEPQLAVLIFLNLLFQATTYQTVIGKRLKKWYPLFFSNILQTLSLFPDMNSCTKHNVTHSPS